MVVLVPPARQAGQTTIMWCIHYWIVGAFRWRESVDSVIGDVVGQCVLSFAGVYSIEVAPWETRSPVSPRNRRRARVGRSREISDVKMCTVSRANCLCLVRQPVHACVRLEHAVSTIPRKSLYGLSPNLQHQCTVGHTWMLPIWGSRGQT